MRPIWIATFVVSALMAPPLAADQVSGSLESGYNRPGGDYDVIELDSAEPTMCFNACANAEQCLAWTYVKPGVEGDLARCHLKSAVPDDSPDPCCTSGVMARAGDLGTLSAGSTSGNADPDHPWSRLRSDGHWCVDDILAADYTPLFVQQSDTRDPVFVFTNPASVGYVGLSGCDRADWNWNSFHQVWIQQSIDYPPEEIDPTYSKKIVYRHVSNGEQVTISYFR